MTTVQSAFYFSGLVAVASPCPCPYQTRDLGHHKGSLWWLYIRDPQQELSPAMGNVPVRGALRPPAKVGSEDRRLLVFGLGGWVLVLGPSHCALSPSAENLTGGGGSLVKAGWCWPRFLLLLTSVPCTSPQASVLARAAGARTDGAAPCHGGWGH